MADEDDGLETIATFPQQVDAVRECRSMMLAEWRTGMIPVYPIPEIILCAGPPLCDGALPMLCKSCYAVPINDPRSAREIVADMQRRNRN